MSPAGNPLSYSKAVSRILDNSERLKIGSQIRKLLARTIPNINTLNCLDVGCSSGVITHELSHDFKSVVGIDVDADAISLSKKNFKKRNLEFRVMNALNLKFKDNIFDVVICNQVYQFTDDPNKMMKEIHRVLKVGGVCFMSARNKYSFYEAQTGIPLIHLLPAFLTNLIMKVLNKKYYSANYLGIYDLDTLFKDFKKRNLTIDILKSPEYFGYNSLSKYSFFFRSLPKPFLNICILFIPNYIFLLEK